MNFIFWLSAKFSRDLFADVMGVHNRNMKHAYAIEFTRSYIRTELVIKFNCASVLHIPIVHAHDVSKQIPREKNFPSGWKCYKTIGSYVSVRSSRYEARGKFGEHERCVRVARGVAKSNFSFLILTEPVFLSIPWFRNFTFYPSNLFCYLQVVLYQLKPGTCCHIRVLGHARLVGQ